MYPYNNGYGQNNDKQPETNSSLQGTEGTSLHTPYRREGTGYTSYSATSYKPVADAKPNRDKGRGRKAGVAAALVAVSLFSGAAGGAGAFYYLNDNQITPVVQPAENAPAQDVAASQPAEQPAVNSATAGGNDIAAIVAKTSASVVEIETQITATNPWFGQYTTGGSGSGVIVSDDGYVVTNNHVVEGGTTITVRTHDGEEYEAELIGTDEQTDLAVLKIDATGLQPVEFADSDNISVGELAVAIGNPLGTLGGTVTSGIISAKNREITIDDQTMTLLQTSAAVSPGNSGGGLFNADGNLIGVVNAKSGASQAEGLAFAIPSNTVRKVMEDMIHTGYVTGRTEFGITVLEIRDPQAAMYYRVNDYGIYVATVTRENGFQQGDRILSVDGVEIEGSASLRTVLDSHEVGDSLEAVVVREGREQTITVTVGEQVPESVREQLVQREV